MAGDCPWAMTPASSLSYVWIGVCGCNTFASEQLEDASGLQCPSLRAFLLTSFISAETNVSQADNACLSVGRQGTKVFQHLRGVVVVSIRHYDRALIGKDCVRWFRSARGSPAKIEPSHKVQLYGGFILPASRCCTFLVSAGTGAPMLGGGSKFITSFALVVVGGQFSSLKR